nr:ferredoxin [Gemmobacter straminiformis]
MAQALAAHHLEILGGFYPEPEDSAPPGTGTLLLVGPAEPGFWAHLTAQPEWRDGQRDPVDRWSERVLVNIASAHSATAIFPFGGPPYHPFYRWALRTGRIWESPVRLLVHEHQGLMVSFRGALALRDRIDLAPPAARPCDGCVAKPCLSACPVGALTNLGYDVPACHAYLDTGSDCLNEGCHPRRACPLSQGYARLAEQSAYHMRRFHGVD